MPSEDPLRGLLIYSREPFEADTVDGTVDSVILRCNQDVSNRLRKRIVHCFLILPSQHVLMTWLGNQICELQSSNILNFRLDLSKMSPDELKDRFYDQGWSVGLTRKVLRFFLSAAKEAGIPLPENIEQHRRLRGQNSDVKPQARTRSAPSSDKGEVVLAVRPIEPVASSFDRLIEVVRNSLPPFQNEWSNDDKKSWYEQQRWAYQYFGDHMPQLSNTEKTNGTEV